MLACGSGSAQVILVIIVHDHFTGILQGILVNGLINVVISSLERRSVDGPNNLLTYKLNLAG